MRKILLSLIIALATASLSQQARAANGLWLEKKDGTKIAYIFSYDLSISYTPESLVITTADGTVEHAFDDVRKVYFDNVTSSIDEQQLADIRQQGRLTAAGISISGFAAQTPVVVADAAGRVIMRRTTAADGSLVISRAELPQGICIVRADKSTIKLNNK